MLTTCLRTDDAMLAFRHFCARCGCPSTICSDNAKILVALSEQVVSHMGQMPRKFMPEVHPTQSALVGQMVGEDGSGS